MKRIIDANINRSTEALRVLEEIARFFLEDEALAKKLKDLRHKICINADKDYDSLLQSRDTTNDIGVKIENKTQRKGIETIFKANIKRLQQALRVLAEYGGLQEIYESSRYESYTIEKIMKEKLMEKLNKYRLKDKNLYLVTNSDNFETQDAFLNAVASALSGGVNIVQLREKNKSAKEIIDSGRKIRELCSMYNALFIVNDRIDIAKIVQADGVHLGQEDAGIENAKEILGEHAIVGISTHEPSQALNAVESGADYIGVGPVFATPTKPGRKSVGLEYVEWAAKNIEIPFFAIGGIDNENCAQVAAAGAQRIAVVRSIMNAVSPDLAAKEFLKQLK